MVLGQDCYYLSFGEVEGLVVPALPVEPAGLGTTNRTAFVVSRTWKGGGGGTVDPRLAP